jgi:tetratricopeptide (TPR) repeat protein
MNDRQNNSIEEWLKRLANYKELLIILCAAISSLYMFFSKWLTEWWFGYGFTEWHLIVLLGCFLFILVLFLFRYSRKKQEARWASFCATGIICLVIGILAAWPAWKLRNTHRTVILINDFEGPDKDNNGITEIIKNFLEEAVAECPVTEKEGFAIGNKISSFFKRRSHTIREITHGVKIITPDKLKKENAKIVSPEVLGRTYGADFVISGSYDIKDKGIEVYSKFSMINQPKSLPGAFRGLLPKIGEIRVFRRDDLENFNLQFYLADKMVYKSFFMLGAGLYTTRHWEAAITCFKKACASLENTRIANLETIEVDRGSSKEDAQMNKYLALLNLLSGDCWLNLDKIGIGIDSYNEGLEYAWKLPENYGRDEILSEIYASRAIAYRERNAFSAAAIDFNQADELREQFEKGKSDKEARVNIAVRGVKGSVYKEQDIKDSLIRSKKYYAKAKFHHAEVEYSFAKDVLTKVHDISEQVSADYQARILSGLAETYYRLGKYERAMEELNSATNMFKKLSVIRRYLKEKDFKEKDLRDNDLEQLERYAHHCRILGEAYLSNREYLKAKQEHNEGKGVYEKLELYYRKQDDNKYLKCQNEIAGQFERLGNIYFQEAESEELPRLWDKGKLAKAQDMYTKAIDRRNQIAKESGESSKYFVLHHLAHTEANVARILIKLDREYETDRFTKLTSAINRYKEALKLLQKPYPNKGFEEQLKEEGQDDLRDDLAWSYTLRAHAYRIRHKNKNTEADLMKAENDLWDAIGLYKELEDAGKDEHLHNRPWTLFELAEIQYRLGKQKSAEANFLAGCEILQKIAKEREKTWCSRDIDEAFNVFLDNPKFVDEYGIKEDTKNVREWLCSDVVMDGKKSLNNVINKYKNNGSK